MHIKRIEPDEGLMKAAQIIERQRKPSQFGDWKPKGHYDWADLGCGKDYVRARYMARHQPKWNLLAVDIELDSTRTEGNLELVQGQLHETLEKLVDGSVGAFNADYCLSNVPYEYALQVLGLAAKKAEPRGMLFLTYRKESEAYVTGMLNKAAELAGANQAFRLITNEPCRRDDLELSPAAKGDRQVTINLKSMRSGKGVSLPVEMVQGGRFHEYLSNPGLYAPMRLSVRLT